MSSRNGAQVRVADHILLDGRLALFHERDRWLAIADLHFGYELSQRAAGNLFPLWGMQTIQARMEELLRDYGPVNLLLLGDLVHDRTATGAFLEWVRELQKATEVVLVSGNHDRGLAKRLNTQRSWHCDGFCFHHGDREVEKTADIQVIGHHHPARVIRDGAGLRLKLPAFIQKDHCWIMPAFSPWAAGTVWPHDDEARVWLCSPTRIIVASASSR